MDVDHEELGLPSEEWSSYYGKKCQMLKNCDLCCEGEERFEGCGFFIDLKKSCGEVWLLQKSMRGTLAKLWVFYRPQ